MKRVALAFVVLLAAMGALAPAAQARVSVGIGVGGWGCCGYAPYYSPYYYGYAPPPAYYYAPPPTVVYQQPPVTYVQPAPTVVQQAPVQEVPPATQTSTTYTDQQGRKCRQFRTAMEDGSPVTGTACLQPDGTWQTVN